MMSINPKQISLTIIKLHNAIQEEKGLEKDIKFSKKESMDLLEILISLFQEKNMLSLQEIFSKLNNLPLKEVESNWRQKYAKHNDIRKIRKHLYFIEESRLIKIVQRKIESLDKFKQIDRYGIQFHWKYTYSRFDNYLRKKNVEF